MEKSTLKRSAAAEIREKLRLLNILVSFVVFILLFVILRYLKGPVSEFLKFLPDMSMLVVILIVMALAAFGLYLSRVLSTQVVKRIEDYSARLDDVLNITRDIRAETYGDILLDRIMDCSLSVTRSDAGSILLVDGDSLVFKTVKGAKAPDLLGKAVPKDTGIGGWVLRESRPVIIGDVKKDARYNDNIDKLTGYQTNSMLCVPLNTRSSPIGVIELLNKHEGEYDDRDIEIISYLADHAAISIERATFYDDQRNYEIHLTDIMLDVIDRFVPEKQGHSKRVAKYANIMAKALGMPEAKKRRLYFACLLHDIGFLKLPAQRFEKAIYMKHPEVGFEMLGPINFYKDIAPFIRYHHERWDGFGYPDGLSGDAVPLESRIIAIAEAFDAMVSDVSYKITVGFDNAVKELLRNRGGQFDPELVTLFAREVKSPMD